MFSFSATAGRSTMSSQHSTEPHPLILIVSPTRIRCWLLLTMTLISLLPCPRHFSYLYINNLKENIEMYIYGDCLREWQRFGQIVCRYVCLLFTGGAQSAKKMHVTNFNLAIYASLHYRSTKVLRCHEHKPPCVVSCVDSRCSTSQLLIIKGSWII